MFDINKFSQLVSKALGDRTITEYSNQSGVNRTYLSKFINKKIDNPPSPDILKRLADTAHNNVIYEDFMEACGYISKYHSVDEKVLEDINFNRVLPVILKHLSDSILKHGHNESKELLDDLDITKSWKYLNDEEKVKLFNSVIKEVKYNKNTNTFSLTQYFVPDEEGYKTLRNDFLEYIAENAINKNSLEYIKESSTDYYSEVHDVEEAMEIILDQPGLMLKGELLSDESKIILANAIQMGLRTAEELEKKKNQGEDHE